MPAWSFRACSRGRDAVHDGQSWPKSQGEWDSDGPMKRPEGCRLPGKEKPLVMFMARGWLERDQKFQRVLSITLRGSP